jgi:sulfite exporter TauE/SafE
MEFRYAVPIAAALVIGFLMLQKAGIVNVIGEGDVTIATALLIGLVASVSTCMAVVGGLVLSFSANYAKGGQPWRAQVIFHISRLASFFVFGGAIGALGAVFQLGRVGMAVMSGLIAVVLLVLGVNLLDVFPWAKRLQPMLPGWLSRKTMRERKQWSGGIAPVLLGAGTFFLPCGFTQSMQIYTLGTGDFAAGALTMTAFALGTLPVLAMLSFTSFGFRDKSWSGIFFKTAGLVVIFFALFNLLNSLAVAGVIPPVFSI